MCEKKGKKEEKTGGKKRVENARSAPRFFENGQVKTRLAREARRDFFEKRVGKNEFDPLAEKENGWKKRVEMRFQIGKNEGGAHNLEP